VTGGEVGNLEGVIRARKRQHLPVVLTVGGCAGRSASSRSRDLCPPAAWPSAQGQSLINAAQEERKPFLQHPQCCHHRGSITVQQGQARASTRREICSDKGPEKATLHPFAAMRDQVDFHPPCRDRISPTVECAPAFAVAQRCEPAVGAANHCLGSLCGRGPGDDQSSHC